MRDGLISVRRPQLLRLCAPEIERPAGREAERVSGQTANKGSNFMHEFRSTATSVHATLSRGTFSVIFALSFCLMRPADRLRFTKAHN